MNWNPAFSPVFKFLKATGVPAFYAWVTGIMADPATVIAIAGDKAPVVTLVLGILSAVAHIGVNATEKK